MPEKSFVARLFKRVRNWWRGLFGKPSVSLKIAAIQAFRQAGERRVADGQEASAPSPKAQVKPTTGLLARLLGGFGKKERKMPEPEKKETAEETASDWDDIPELHEEELSREEAEERIKGVLQQGMRQELERRSKETRRQEEVREREAARILKVLKAKVAPLRQWPESINLQKVYDDLNRLNQEINSYQSKYGNTELAELHEQYEQVAQLYIIAYDVQTRIVPERKAEMAQRIQYLKEAGGPSIESEQSLTDSRRSSTDSAWSSDGEDASARVQALGRFILPDFEDKSFSNCLEPFSRYIPTQSKGRYSQKQAQRIQFAQEISDLFRDYKTYRDAESPEQMLSQIERIDDAVKSAEEKELHASSGDFKNIWKDFSAQWQTLRGDLLTEVEQLQSKSSFRPH